MTKTAGASALPTSNDPREIAGKLTKGGREFFRLSDLNERLTGDDNPWPLIGMRERMGGARERCFTRLQAKGLFNRGNNLTPLGLQVRAILLEEAGR